MKATTILFTFFFIATNCIAQVVQSDRIEVQITELLNAMTLEEKVGQMNQYNGSWDITGPPPKDELSKLKYDHIRKGWVGAVLNVRGAKDVRHLQEMAVNESRLGIPLMFGSDIIHGYKTLAPIPLAEAASWDLEAIELSSRVAAIEASAVGVNWTFAPMVDISRDARWGRVMEGAGEDPYLGAKVGVARVKGFQTDDLSANNSIAATAKHFAAYGFGEAGREYNTVDIGTGTLYNIVLPPFKAVVDNNVRTVMNAFNVLNGVPATANTFLQRDILKNGWGFDGFVVSDWDSGEELMDHGFARDLAHVAELAANAGSDMDMESYAYVFHLKKAVEEGRVNIEVVNDAVRRILRIKFELGLFDDPYRYCSEEREKTLLYHPDHHAAVLDMAKKSIVLLKNETNLLPLKKDQKKIAVIGALAADKTSSLGNWRIGSDDGTAISLLEGLQAYTDEFTYAKGADVIYGDVKFFLELDENNDDDSGFREAVALAKASDVVIMALGEHGFHSGEGRSRTKLGLPGVQQKLLEVVYAVNPNIILVLTNGRPLTITWADEHIPTILECWQLGTQSGNAIAQTIFGDNNPSGKLPMTFPRSVGQVPIYYNHLSTGRPDPAEGMVFWSHYIDEEHTPLYPFGYGLSYTDFKYSDLKVDESHAGEIRVSVRVTNAGIMTGQEVVQMYIRDRVATVSRPVRELKGFEKIELRAGASKIVHFTLTAKELGFYNNQGKFVVEPGWFALMVGTNSEKGLIWEFEWK